MITKEINLIATKNKITNIKKVKGMVVNRKPCLIFITDIGTIIVPIRE